LKKDLRPFITGTWTSMCSSKPLCVNMRHLPKGLQWCDPNNNNAEGRKRNYKTFKYVQKPKKLRLLPTISY